MPQKNKSNELKISRVFDAPLEAVWEAWADPEQIAQWWGPRGFTITTHSKDLRTGGTWKYTMHGPDGTDYPNIAYYREVRPQEALVYDHGATEDRPPLFQVSVYSHARGHQTAMEMTMTLPTPEAAEQIRKLVKQAGGESTWDRLAEYVRKETDGKDLFIINRSFDPPLPQVSAMWTSPAHLAQWLPPAGMRMETISGTIEQGGTLFARMHATDLEFHVRFSYRHVDPEQIVYTQQFCDQQGHPSRHPLAPGWPETILTSVRFTAEGPERTRVTVSCEPIDAPSQPELDLFLQGRGGMTAGWTGSFDQLDALLLAGPDPS